MLFRGVRDVDVCSSTWLNALRREGTIDQGRSDVGCDVGAEGSALLVGGRGGKWRKRDWGLSVLDPSTLRDFNPKFCREYYRIVHIFMLCRTRQMTMVASLATRRPER